MKTLLFSTTWSDSAEHMQSRAGRWIDHHARLPYPCEVELAVIGDGVEESISWPDGDYHRVNLMPHLGRPSHLDYPGWWRSFGYAAMIARQQGCQRIWHVESDFFIASWRMICKLNEIEQGWIAFWCPRHNMPETAIQVISEHHYAELASLGERYDKHAGRHAEHLVPFTTIVRNMVGDRYGEVGTPPESIEGLDFYGQCPGSIGMIFRDDNGRLP